MWDLCSPVVGAVPGHVAADVETLQDVEGSNQGRTSVRRRSRHDMVSL